MRPPIRPIAARKSQYGVDPSLVGKRVADMPGMVSLLVRDLFPDAPDTIFPGEGGIEAVREATAAALARYR